MRGRERIGLRVAPVDAPAPPRPTPVDVPLDVARTSLYTARELYDTPRYADSLDARVYAWSRAPADRDAALARALHDHAIDQALEMWVRRRPIVGVMGGHALDRGTPAYDDAARLGRELGVAHVVATGGGPGAMEAANLGGRLAGHGTDVLDDALTRLAAVPAPTPSVDPWVAAAIDVVEATDALDEPRPTLGIPTWHYGHEPPNVFATAIAKYVRNATREAILLEVCTSGIVFLPGAGGTVQEIFQDACDNYYATEAAVAPMVLVGRDHWTRELPAWPLLQRLAEGRAMAGHVHLVDGLDEAAEVIAASRPADA